jgi:hypothetical protein
MVSSIFNEIPQQPTRACELKPTRNRNQKPKPGFPLGAACNMIAEGGLMARKR